MKNLQRITIILLILILVFGSFVLFDRPDLTLRAPKSAPAIRYSTSVAWLEMCAAYFSEQMIAF